MGCVMRQQPRRYGELFQDQGTLHQQDHYDKKTKGYARMSTIALLNDSPRSPKKEAVMASPLDSANVMRNVNMTEEK